MGFLGLIIFSLKCLDFIAWPLCAFCYPLWASIRAIETNSKHHMRKLVTYWTLFAFISLFELAFMRLIDWIPFWPYIKLISVCLLVIPRFTGACYVYQGLVHPCLSVNWQVVGSHLYNSKEGLSVDKDAFLSVAERYLRENGPEGLEKLIASKLPDGKSSPDVKEVKAAPYPEKEVAANIQQVNYKDPDVSQKDIETVQPTEENTVVAAKGVGHVKENIQVETNEKPIAKFEKMTMPTVVEDYSFREMTDLKQVQNEWTCALCQVTTTSETTLNSHFRGRKHKDKSEALKANKPAAAKNTDSAQSIKSKINQSVKDHPKSASGNAPTQVKSKKQEEKQPSNVFSRQQRKLMKEKNSTATGDVEKLTQGKGKLWCDVCNVRCPGEIDMAAHLKGRRHSMNVQAKLALDK